MTGQIDRYSSNRYRIKLKGRLDKKWADWFEGMAITYKGGDSILTGPVSDQAALHGLLNKIRDLNLTLLSVDRIESKGNKTNNGSKEGLVWIKQNKL